MVLAKLVEAEVAEIRPHLVRRLRHVGKAEALAGIEVEDDAVGPVRLVDARPPGVDLEDAHLHERDEPGRVLDEQVGARFLEARDVDLAELGRHARAGVALIEAFALAPGRAAHERDRPARHMREHRLGDGEVVLGKLALGDALLGIEHLVRARQPDARDLDLVAVFCHSRLQDRADELTRAGLLLHLLEGALLRRLVGPPAQELGAVAEAAAGDVVVAHLDDELGPERHPFGRALGRPAARAAGRVAGEARSRP